MRRAARALAACFLLALVGQAAAQAQTSLPLDKGMPIKVKVAVAFAELLSFSENAGTFKATVDVRLRWEDPRLRRPAIEANDPPKVYRGADADAQMAALWTPAVELANQRNKSTYMAQGVRVFPDGRVELIKRTTAEFAMDFNVERFPFDRQKLQLDVAMRAQTADAVALEFDQNDLDFSRAAASTKLDGWTIGSVSLRSEPVAGWYGASHARVSAFLEVARQPGTIVASVFLPLFASLLIPVLAIWLNRVADGRFQIETFELTNVIIGGLFAVIALNFTVNSVYQVLGTGDNPVNRLFALNYITLAIGLLVNILLFRFEVVGHLLGRYVQEQLYLVLIWAIPLLGLTMACAILLVAVL
jgi:hypothetical protein